MTNVLNGLIETWATREAVQIECFGLPHNLLIISEKRPEIMKLSKLIAYYAKYVLNRHMEGEYVLFEYPKGGIDLLPLTSENEDLVEFESRRAKSVVIYEIEEVNGAVALTMIIYSNNLPPINGHRTRKLVWRSDYPHALYVFHQNSNGWEPSACVTSYRF